MCESASWWLYKRQQEQWIRFKHMWDAQLNEKKCIVNTKLSDKVCDICDCDKKT